MRKVIPARSNTNDVGLGQKKWFIKYSFKTVKNK